MTNAEPTSDLKLPPADDEEAFDDAIADDLNRAHKGGAGQRFGMSLYYMVALLEESDPKEKTYYRSAAVAALDGVIAKFGDIRGGADSS